MTERAFVREHVQVGIESTYGTAVAADHNLRSMSVDIDAAGDNELFRPDGHKFNALAIHNMEWCTIAVNGKLTYTETDLILASIFGAPTTTTVGSTGKKRVYDQLDTAADATQSLTIQKGQAARAHQVAGAILTDYTFTFSRKNGATLAGTGIGQLLTDPVTLTASPTDLELTPLSARDVSLFIDATAAGLGTTQMLRAFNVVFDQKGKYGPVWTLDNTQPTFATFVELAAANTCTLRLEADAAGMAHLADYRADSLIFVRLQAIGRVFEAGTPPLTYTLDYDVALAIKTPKNLGADEDGIVVIDYDCEMVRDSTWGKAVEVTTINDVASYA